MSGLRDWVIEAVAAYRNGTGSAEQCREAAEAAVREGANLSCANLSGAYLNCADLSCADLSCADLRYADLRGAYLNHTDLRGANLRGADLWGADLSGATINWQSHDLVSGILCRAAGEVIERRKIAGLVLVSRDWCWDQFLAHDDPQREWALSVLRKYVRDGDGAPKILR